MASRSEPVDLHAAASVEPEYQVGFDGEHASEALAGALPSGQFSPQKAPHGLYPEKLSVTAFTVQRAGNRRTWLYRIRPSVLRGEFTPMARPSLTIPVATPPPNPLRWDPLPIPESPQDFLDGLVAFCGNGDPRRQNGMAVHLYLANRSMKDRFFYDADGELLLVPQLGRLRLHTECGVLLVAPREIALIPKGMKFRVVLPDGPSRGYVCENFGVPFTLPERGLVGSDGFANDRDFRAPVAAFEDREGHFDLACKFGGELFTSAIDHSPLDVVAWVGTAVPCKYNLDKFNAMGTVTYDHPDPSINTVLTSPSDTAGVANVDFVIFPPRWLVAEGTFRPPWFHRNVMSEFMGLIRGTYDGKREGFLPGGASLHNALVPHGPDAATFAANTKGALKPAKLENTMAFMFESRFILHPTEFALETDARQRDYADCWRGLERNFSDRG